MLSGVVDLVKEAPYLDAVQIVLTLRGLMNKAAIVHKPNVDATSFALMALPIDWLRSAREDWRAGRVLEAQADRDQAARVQRAQAATTDEEKALIYADYTVPRIRGQSHMLFAFALECALKGIRVAQAPSLTASGKLDSAIGHHNIRELAKDAGIVLTADEAAVCEYLETAADSFGRYPGAVKAAKQTTIAVTDPRFASIVRGLHTRLMLILIPTVHPQATQEQITTLLGMGPDP